MNCRERVSAIAKQCGFPLTDEQRDMIADSIERAGPPTGAFRAELGRLLSGSKYWNTEAKERPWRSSESTQDSDTPTNSTGASVTASPP